MKAYKLEILIIDHDDVGEEEIAYIIKNANYPNDCISPEVKSVDEAEIGEWTDDHPLNNSNTCGAEYDKLFGPK